MLGGFQLLAHDAGGFGALTEGLLTHLRDEYARTPVVRLVSAPRPDAAAWVAELCVRSRADAVLHTPAGANQ